jgi:hypothetical protein
MRVIFKEHHPNIDPLTKIKRSFYNFTQLLVDIQEVDPEEEFHQFLFWKYKVEDEDL